jgi:DNA-binding response OmpR family regulator
MNTEGEGSGPTAPAPEPSVLVVEGDVMIRLVVAAYLRECGFKVVEASSADEALTVLKTDRKIAIDVAFVDMDIAGSLDGFGLSQWIRRERAEIKIILASGAHRTAKEAGHLCEHGPVMRKPYDHKDLERQIRQMLLGR